MKHKLAKLWSCIFAPIMIVAILLGGGAAFSKINPPSSDYL